jgi:alanine racemase
VNNIRFLKELIGKGIKFSSVVKANAYGHGIEQFVLMAERAGVNHFSVFSGDEAHKVAQSSRNNSEIMIMGWLDAEEMKWAIESGIDFWIFDAERLDLAIDLSKSVGKSALIHLEMETGMNRTGLSEDGLKYVIHRIQSYPDNIAVRGVCTHYAGAESIANFVRVNRQISKFNRYYREIVSEKIYPKYRHTACSAAALNYPKTRMDMVRIGIAQYGFWPSIETFIQYVHNKEDRFDPLDRIISWKSTVMSVKRVPEGEFISYGTTYLAQEEKLIAIVPVGYSHGFSRMLSNQGRVIIRGQRVGVIGMVNMNMLIADVTFVPGVCPGDEVVIIGKQDNIEITVASFSEISNQVNYELLVRLPGRTTRKVVD